MRRSGMWNVNQQVSVQYGSSLVGVWNSSSGCWAMTAPVVDVRARKRLERNECCRWLEPGGASGGLPVADRRVGGDDVLVKTLVYPELFAVHVRRCPQSGDGAEGR